MRLYFSGINSSSNWETVTWLNQANVKYWLLDQFDMNRLVTSQVKIPTDIKLILDSGAYALFKQGKLIDVESYINFIQSCPLKFEFVVAPDVIGDRQQTEINWRICQKYPDIPWMPVWGWGEEHYWLLEYLQEAPIVGVGGLVPLMRMGSWGKTPDEKQLASQMLSDLTDLCFAFPDRLHIFGINWLKAIEVLSSIAASGDTSKAWTGARRAHVIFQNTKTGKLQSAPAKAIPQYSQLNRGERCILSAKELNNYCNREVIASDVLLSLSSTFSNLVEVLKRG